MSEDTIYMAYRYRMYPNDSQKEFKVGKDKTEPIAVFDSYAKSVELFPSVIACKGKRRGKAMKQKTQASVKMHGN